MKLGDSADDKEVPLGHISFTYIKVIKNNVYFVIIVIIINIALDLLSNIYSTLHMILALM